MLTQPELISACQRRNPDAFSQLVDMYQKPIYNYAYQMTGNYHDAQDVVQETFLRVYTSVHLFQGKGSLTGWVYRIAANLCIDRARRLSRRPTCSLDAAVGEHEAAWQLPDETPGPDEKAEQSDLQQLLRTCLQGLPREHRQVIILHDVRGLTYGEIAQALGCPVGTVKSRLSRARARLRVILDDHGVVHYWKQTAHLAPAV